jgi:hypothetical protein
VDLSDQRQVTRSNMRTGMPRFITGELSAQPFNVDKGGLFRSFKMQGAGVYKVHAHVGAGDLTLKN